MFKRILVANRGEIALRVIRACGKLGIESVAVYSEADAESPHLEEADQIVCIGPARSTDSYLNMAAIIQAAEQYDCSAIHPGYGFLSENALFAELCESAKMTFIGPPASAIRLMGDKATARETMRAVGLPVIPGSRGTLRDVNQGLEFAREIGFPVLLKATAGGGGRGMRRVDSAREFEAKYSEASLEAEKAFNNRGLYLERYIIEGRHIEFQVLADAFGNAVHLGERECSAQRRHQKLVEESPSPVIGPELRAELGEKVREAVVRIGYRNAGTLEFFRDKDGQLYFMEMNTRLQVEHPVSEMVTNRDIVNEQIRIAANERLSFSQGDVEIEGHSIECRINAEDPFDEFMPSPGLIEEFQPPAQTASVRVRVDSHVQPGYRVPIFYDSMIAKLIVHGEDRTAARIGMIESLKQFKVSGVDTTIPVHLRIMEDDDFAAGNYDTGFIERLLSTGAGE
jgi:acetyl-CoA carboxylase biotin carboxylase subunit